MVHLRDPRAESWSVLVVALLAIGLVCAACEQKPGCGTDKDCKGDRVCVKGECKDRSDSAKSASNAPTSTGRPSAVTTTTTTTAPTAPQQPPAAPGGATLQACKTNPRLQNAYAISVSDVVAAARLIAGGTGCTSTQELVDLLQSCGNSERTGLVHVEAAAKDRTACNIDIHTLELDGRQWVNLTVFVGIEAQFHAETHIFEFLGGRPQSYYEGFSGAAPLCSGDSEPDPGTKVSPQMRTDWSAFSKVDQDKFFCSDGSDMPAGG